MDLSDTVVKSLTCRCMKRGCVQILRKLGICDVDIMKRVFMTGEGAYLNYAEIFKHYHAEAVPRFGNASAALFDAELREEFKRQDLLMATQEGVCLRDESFQLGLFLQSCDVEDTDGVLDLFGEEEVDVEEA